MAFVLQVVCGQVRQARNDSWHRLNTRITLVSELGGQVLGFFDTKRFPHDSYALASDLVDNLQRKAQKLLPNKAKLPQRLMQLRYKGKLISGAFLDTRRANHTRDLDYDPLNHWQRVSCELLLLAKQPVVTLCWDEHVYELARTDMQNYGETFTLNNNTLTVHSNAKHYTGLASWPRLFEKDVPCVEVELASDCVVSPWATPSRTLRFPVQRFRGGHKFTYGWAENLPQALFELDVRGGRSTCASQPRFPPRSSIKQLRLSRLKLDYVPVSIFRLLNLTALDLSDNDLRSVPNEIELLTELENLNLSNNPKLSGSLHLATCTKLKELNVLGCTFGFGDFRLGAAHVRIIS